MATFTQSLMLDVAGRNRYKYIYAKQGDSGSRFVNVTMLANGVQIVPESGTTAKIRAMKPDGTGVFNSATINANGTITAALTSQMLAVKGDVQADIMLVGSNNEILSTVTFYIKVEEAPAGDVVESSNEFLELIEMRGVVTQAARDAAEAKIAAQDAQSAIGEKGDNLWFNEEDGKLYLMSEGAPIGDGVAVNTGGSGGGGGAGIPEALPNPYALTFTGAVTGTYDGSAAVTVEIPSGGGSGTAKTQKLIDVTLDEATASISVTLEHNFHRLFLVWDSGSNGVARIVDADGNAISSALTVLLDTTTVSWNARKVGIIATDTSTYKSDALIMEWTDDVSTYIRSNRYFVQSGTSSSVYNTFGGYSAMAGTLGTADALTPVAGRTVNIVPSSGYFAPTTKIKLVGEYYE